jgi:Acetyltransferase (GNAT) family
MAAILYSTVSTNEEIHQIKALQAINLRGNIDDSTAASQGFLTAEYTYDYLEQMNSVLPSIIAKDGSNLAGYALVADKSVLDGHDLLSDLFRVIDKTEYSGRLLRDVNYVVVGQLCVAEAYRGKGLVQGLYGFYRDCYADQFEYLVTDVAQANIRSLKAHLKAGFEVIDTLVYGGIGWDLVLWDWRNA